MLVALGGVQVNWETQMKKIYKVTKEVKLQFFQYKIFTKILYSPRKALLYKRSDSDSCVFCKNSVGTIVHMYAECRVAVETV